MCVVALAWKAHPRWQLVMAGNRDEFHGRPSAAIARWDDPRHLIGGKDLQSGGMWLGISEQGRFAVVTNLAGSRLPDPSKDSRGALVRDYLASGALDAGQLDRFNPFNLLVADSSGLRFLSNRPEPVQHPLPPGVHSLSNGVPDAPWPRRHALEAQLGAWLGGPPMDPSSLFAALVDERIPDGGPDEEPPTPIFIRNPVYGTRCSTVIAIEGNGAGIMIERAFEEDGSQTGEARVAFHWLIN
jgi:uncharacterized protein with NRDE domain